ncbi:MAG: hypothetical protein ACJ71G_10590 [Nitrososphaeraceae archaeon]
MSSFEPNTSNIETEAKKTTALKKSQRFCLFQMDPIRLCGDDNMNRINRTLQ